MSEAIAGPLRLGVDLGGTKTEIIALDERGCELLRRRVPTPRDDYAATVAQIAALVQAAESEFGRSGTVGVGIPGAESLIDGRIRNANSTWLNGRSLRADLEAALARPVRLMNDANCFALSEATDGAGAGADSVFGVILGTGVGGGIVIAGQVLSGANAIAGEWGHNPLPGEHHRLPCWCGRRGCIESYLSGPALLAEHRREGGEAASVEEIVARAEAGDAECAATLARYEARLARALATVINLLDPEVIVLGGGLSNIRRLYDTVPRLWAPHVFCDRVDTRLLPNRHGDSSGVRGAAWLGTASLAHPRFPRPS